MAKAKYKMRELKLLKIGGALEDRADYRDLLLQICRTPKNQKLATIEEMENVMPLIKKLRDAEPGDTILITESEHKELKDRLRTFGFGVNAEAILDMKKHVVACPEVSVDKAPPEAEVDSDE